MRHWFGIVVLHALVLPAAVAQDGRRITLDDNRGLWLACTGTGRPTVLLEAGHTESSATWQRVQPRLGALTRVCSYDRAGRGRSDPPPTGPRLGRDVVRDLHGLLGVASEPGPYVLVGHSLGGAFVRLYAESYPSEVAALVLVDAVHEGELAAIDKLLTPEQRLAGAGMRPFSPEGIDIEGVYRELAASKRPFPLPVVVVARGRPLGADEMPPDWTAEQRRRREELRVALQADLAALSADGELLVAKRSGHFVHHEEPEILVGAVRGLIERWRRGATPRRPGGQVRQQRPLWGSLEPGPFAVGFRVLHRLDRSRVWGSPADSALRGEFARPVRISLWYPASPDRSTARMSYREYAHVAAPDASFARLNRLSEERDTTSLRRMFAGVERDYPGLLALPMAARRNAPAAPGRFPLVVYSQGWNSSHPHDNVVLAEYLASHGYLVVSVPQVGESVTDLTLRINPIDLEVQMRDVEFAVGVAHALPFADRRRTGLMGWSMGGVVSLWISGRNPAVRAIVGLDASFRARDFVSLTMGSPYFDIRRLRTPMLALQSGNVKSVGGQDDRVVDSLHFAERLIGRVDNITHGDFSDFAMIARLYPVTIVDRTADEASRGHETVCRVVRSFLDQVLKSDGRTLELASADSRFPGVSLVRRRSAEVPSEEEFVAMVSRQGLAPAVGKLRQLRQAYPGLVIVRYPVLTRIGYRLLREGRTDTAIDAFRLNTEAYPTAADGFDSLADGYLAKGDTASARGAYERVLELVPSDSTLGVDAREELRRRTVERLRALRSP